MERERAKELWQKYQRDAHYETPYDAEIKRAYKLLSQGKTLIKVRDSILAAGVDEKGLPKLAIARADLKEVIFTAGRDTFGFYGSEHSASRWQRAPRTSNTRFEFDREDMPGLIDWRNSRRRKAMLPMIPADLRPKRALQGYHILWEAEWEMMPPIDPYLLKRVGKSDLWLVCAAWDLTEVERAAMASRISVQ